MKTQNPWMGRARGSAGNMTSSKVYDKNVMRAKAFEVNNPKTAAQTNERNFFAEAQSVCQTVSEEQLRSLFGVKPKSKSRRNALLSQLLEAFSINDGVKEFDFSKLNAIGNGEKVNTPIAEINRGATLEEFDITAQSLNVQESNNPNLIIVLFNSETNAIEIINTEIKVSDEFTYMNMAEDYLVNKTGYFYVTCATDGSNVYEKSFGSFIIKTRAEKKTTSQPSN